MVLDHDVVAESSVLFIHVLMHIVVVHVCCVVVQPYEGQGAAVTVDESGRPGLGSTLGWGCFGVGVVGRCISMSEQQRATHRSCNQHVH